MTTEVSRRNITKAATWSVPVIATAIAAPAQAASVPNNFNLSAGTGLDFYWDNNETTQGCVNIVPNNGLPYPLTPSKIVTFSTTHSSFTVSPTSVTITEAMAIAGQVCTDVTYSYSSNWPSTTQYLIATLSPSEGSAQATAQTELNVWL
ncbi:MAG: hypothetical protein QM632_07040 [Micrococcaceae bacterium]